MAADREVWATITPLFAQQVLRRNAPPCALPHNLTMYSKAHGEPPIARGGRQISLDRPTPMLSTTLIDPFEVLNSSYTPVLTP